MTTNRLFFLRGGCLLFATAATVCILVLPAKGAQPPVGVLNAADEKAEYAEGRARAGTVEEVLGADFGDEVGQMLHALLQAKDEKRLSEVLDLTQGPQLLMSAMLPKSIPDMRAALEWVRTVQERKYGPNDPRVGNTIMRLGILAAVTEDQKQARILLTRGLDLQTSRLDEISKTKLANDLEATTFGLGLVLLAYILEHEHDYNGAAARARQGKIIAIAQHDLTQQVTCETRLAEIALVRGEPAKAMEGYQEARKIYAASKFGGPDEISKLYAGMALAYLDQGQSGEARRMARLVWDTDRRNLQNLLTMPEHVALKSVGRLDYYSLAAALGDTNELADKILHCKGCVLEAAFTNRSMGGEPDVFDFTSDLARWNQARRDLTQVESESPELRNTQELKEKREEVRKWEAALASHGIKPRVIEPSVDAVNNTLGPRRALVEFARYNHYLGSGQWERAYGAMVFTQGQPPRWVHLGRVLAVEEQITTLQKILRDSEAADSAGLRKVLDALHATLWQPLTAFLPTDATDIIVSPDGALAFVPFAVLLDPKDQFLAESFRVSYVTSGRDLLRTTPEPASGPFALFGNPTFREHRKEVVKRSTSPTGDPGTAESELEPLTNSAAECDRIARVLEEHRIKCKELLADAASEANLAKLRSPFGLHFATHGELATRRRATDLRSLVDNSPGQRSVLYLAGAQDTLDARARGVRAPLNDEQFTGPHAGGERLVTRLNEGIQPLDASDGIVTAQEISKYHLEGTRLVTLSACETGLGDARSGEGVLGLRRSFVEAGAQNLLVSLWKIPDDRTPDMMADFYSRAFPGGDIVGAWADTQREWLNKLRYVGAEDHLFDSVYCAGAFVLSRQGPP